MNARFRSVETNLAIALACALASIWIFGANSGARLTHAEVVPIDQPIASGWIATLALLGLVALNSVFVAGETAVQALRTLHVRHVKEENAVLSERLRDLVDHREKYATACLLGSRIARLCLVFFVLILAQGLTRFLERVAKWPFDLRTLLVSLLIIGIPVILVNLVLGELVPKSYASLHPHKVGGRLFRIIQISSIALSWPASLLVKLATVFTQRFGGTAAFASVNQAEEEIKTLAESAEETGQIESEEKELIHSVFEFNDRVAREIMTPRVDLDAMPIRSDPADVVKVIEESGHSRIPLYEDSDDQIVGVIHAKDLLMAMVEQPNRVSLRALMRPAVFVPENKGLTELLRELRTSRSQLAIVQDEFGGTAGIVSIEDIVEELVGEIVDEYDEEELPVVELPTGWMVSGKTHVDDVNHLLHSDFDGDEFETIGGFLFGQFGRQPRNQEKIEVDGYCFTVAETDGRRILRLMIERTGANADTGPASVA